MLQIRIHEFTISKSIVVVTVLEDKEDSCVSEFETDWVFSNAREGSIKLEDKENSCVSEFETDRGFLNAREDSTLLFPSSILLSLK